MDVSEAQLEALAADLGAVLRRQGWILATAESCTGGWLAQVVTSVSGSSAWFDRGFVTYSNAAKRDMLGVPAETLMQFGAVSEETAREMVRGALAHSAAQLAIAITGIAGPGGGTPEKPVGSVCFAWALAGQPCASATRFFSGDRRQIRAASVGFALRQLLALVP
ncbi:MAG: damage-inducible protein CinA [Hydrogenophilales bacterium 28-61-23]|nr:MAG: damage-inducible protein CinA [Hydrogenophilales bacterium 28-61-23]